MALDFCCLPGGPCVTRTVTFQSTTTFFFSTIYHPPEIFEFFEVDDGCIQQTDRSSYYIWQYFTVSNSSEAKKGGAKIAVCKFCDKTFSGCCTTGAAAHILGRPVLGQTKAGIQTCMAINKKDDDRRAILKNAQRVLWRSHARERRDCCWQKAKASCNGRDSYTLPRKIS